jgi:hypothetical protein
MEMVWKVGSGPILMYPGICLEEARETTNLNQDSQCPGQFEPSTSRIHVRNVSLELRCSLPSEIAQPYVLTFRQMSRLCVSGGTGDWVSHFGLTLPIKCTGAQVAARPFARHFRILHFLFADNGSPSSKLRTMECNIYNTVLKQKRDHFIHMKGSLCRHK